MFDPITPPFGAKTHFNTVKLKSGVTFDDKFEALAGMCTETNELGYDFLRWGMPVPERG